MKSWRAVLGVLGTGAAAFGAVELITGAPPQSLLRVAIWLTAALIIHDALWSPGLIGIAALLTRVPARARRHLQGGLVVAGALVVIAAPMIYLRGSQPASKAILLQDVAANLVLLVGIVAAAGAGSYGWRVIRDRGRRRADPGPDPDIIDAEPTTGR